MGSHLGFQGVSLDRVVTDLGPEVLRLALP